MLDEFDKPLGKADADKYGDDAEAPVIPHPTETSAHRHRSDKETNPAQRYAGPALERLRWPLAWAWTALKWFGTIFVSASFWTALATVGIAIATVKYTQYAQKQWDTMQGQLNEMVNQSRPWIKVTALELRSGSGPIKTLGFHWPLTGAVVPPVLQVKVSMLNVGHSVAQDVEVWPELFFGKFQSDKWYDVVKDEQQRFCRSVTDRRPTGAANIVFPSDSSESNMGVGGVVHGTDVVHVPGNPASYAAASLIFCVNYRGVGSIPYQTQARSSLYEDNQVLITIGLDADADHLRLIREPNGDHAN